MKVTTFYHRHSPSINPYLNWHTAMALTQSHHEKLHKPFETNHIILLLHAECFWAHLIPRFKLIFSLTALKSVAGALAYIFHVICCMQDCMSVCSRRRRHRHTMHFFGNIFAALCILLLHFCILSILLLLVPYETACRITFTE